MDPSNPSQPDTNPRSMTISRGELTAEGAEGAETDHSGFLSALGALGALGGKISFLHSWSFDDGLV